MKERRTLIAHHYTDHGNIAERSVTGDLEPRRIILVGQSSKYRATVTIPDRRDSERIRYSGEYIVRRYIPKYTRVTPELVAEATKMAEADLEKVARGRMVNLPFPDVVRLSRESDGSPSLVVTDVGHRGKVPTWSLFHDDLQKLANVVGEVDCEQHVLEQLDTISASASRVQLWVSERGILLLNDPKDGIKVMITDFNDGLFDGSRNSAERIRFFNNASKDNYFEAFQTALKTIRGEHPANV